MGEVIRKDAAADDIIADVRAAAIDAATKEDKLKALAEELLSPLVKLIDAVDVRRKDAAKVAAPIVAAISTEDNTADKLLLDVHDVIYNALKRPANDPALAILYPGGTTVYTEGPNEEQPDRMDLLAELLEAAIHPRLDASTATASATRVRSEAETYRALVDSSRKPLARVKLLDKVWIAIARIGQISLTRLKKRYLAEGFTEVQVHTVIPDRPRPSGPPAPAPTMPPAGTGPNK